MTIFKVESYQTSLPDIKLYWVYYSTHKGGKPFKVQAYTSNTVPKNVLDFMSENDYTQFGDYLKVYRKELTP